MVNQIKRTPTGMRPATLRLRLRRQRRVLRGRIVMSFRQATASQRLLPSFLVIGAQKSGTTSLFTYLTALPTIGGSRPKEVHYFSRNFSRDIDWYRAHFPFERFRRRVEQRFGVEPAIGEKSPYYLFHPLAPTRVHEFDPEMKLVAVLRDPIDRAYSHYYHEQTRHREPLSFEEALAAEPRRVEGELERMLADPNYYSNAHQRYTYLARGRYAEQLERWLDLFPREQLLVLSTDDLGRDPAGTVGQVLHFLGLPASQALNDYPHQNRGRYADPIAPPTRERLAVYFEEHNRRLYELIGRDFGWTKPAKQGT